MKNVSNLVGFASKWRRSSIIGYLVFIGILAFNCFSPLLYGESVVLGIDLGHQYIKVAMISQGRNFEMLLNSHSKRKSYHAISYADEKRHSGDEAIKHITKFPSKVITQTMSLLGQTFSMYTDPMEILNLENVTPITVDNQTQYFEGLGVPHSFFPYEFNLDTTRGTVNIHISEDLTLSPEEGIASVLSHIKKLTQQALELKPDEPIDIECVFSIPCSYTQRQRQALVDAANLVGMHVMNLIHNTAAAGVFRMLDLKSNQTESSLIYDFGARNVDIGHLRLLNAYQTKENKNNKTRVVELLGCTSVPNVGGIHFDIELAKEMAKVYEENKGKSLMTMPSSLKKVLRQAAEVKHILSTNKKTDFSVETITPDGDDFYKGVSRDHFEQLIREKNMIEAITNPISHFFDYYQISKESFDTVEIVGAGWRVPLIKQELAAYFNPKPLGFHLNGDEAMAMGAAYVAANHSAFFFVPDIRVSDLSVYNYTAVVRGHVYRPNKDEALIAGEVISKNSTLQLFTPTSKLTGSKKIKIMTKEPIQVELYEDQNMLAAYDITFPEEALKHESYPVVNIIFKADNNGIIALEKAYALYEEKENKTDVEAKSSDKEMPKKTDGDASHENVQMNQENVESNTNEESKNETEEEKVAKSEKTTDPESQDTDDKGGNDTTQDTTTSTPPTTTSTTTTTTASMKRYDLLVKTALSFPLPLSIEQKEVSREKISHLDKIDKRIEEHEQSLNELETTIYLLRDKLIGDSIYKAVVSPENYTSTLSLLEETEDWHYAYSKQSTTEQLQSKTQHLLSLFQPWDQLAFEYKQRENVTKIVNEFEQHAAERLAVIEGREWIEQDDKDVARTAFESFKDWWNQVFKTQKGLMDYETPAFTKKEVMDAIKKVKKQLAQLGNITTTTTTTAATVTSSTTDTDSTLDTTNFVEMDPIEQVDTDPMSSSTNSAETNSEQNYHNEL